MPSCPDCSQALDFIEGRNEWWCNGCVASKAGPPMAPQAEADAPSTMPESTTRRDVAAGHAAADVAETAVSLIVVVPILVIGGGAAALLATFGMTTAALGVAIATLALVALCW